MRAAAIGIGSNSLRMLLAEAEEGRLSRLKRYRDGLRLFAALDAEGNLPEETLSLAAEKVRAFCRQAVEDGAEKVFIFATSAVRDAKNRDVFLRRLEEMTGIIPEVCGGETEARLSFWGAAKEGCCAVIDIGGGSTEIACGTGKDVFFTDSLQVGAVRMFRETVIENEADALALAARLEKTFTPYAERIPQETVWVGVGGTFTTVAALAQKIPWDRKESIHGYPLTEEQIRLAIAELSPIPPAERAKLPWLQPQRADIIVHGLAILLACFRAFGFREIEVSEYGNLEGYLKSRFFLS